MRFRDRFQAARLLADTLSRYRGRHPLVLAIPRGAVPMGQVLAEALGGELDVALVRKLCAPGNPELAVGSIDESGTVYLDPDGAGLVSAEFLRQEAARQLEVLRRRRRTYAPIRPPLSPTGRVAIVLDDGIATGSTMVAALRAVRARRPARLVAAAAVAPARAVAALEAECDEVACLSVPGHFLGVGQFFEDFGQVSDEEVARILAEAGRRPPG